MTRSVNRLVQPEAATDLYDVRRLAEFLGVKSSSIRSMRIRGQLPEPTARDINGGAVWSRDVVEDYFISVPSSAPGKSKEAQPSAGVYPQLIDLFSGCGGMSLGFELAGFGIMAGFDNWTPAVDTYNANFQHPASVLDLSNVEETIATLEQFEGAEGFPGIIGGPPCQDFSSAGPRVEGARADLTEKFATIVERFNPPFFVMENVARAEHAAAFKRALTIMENAGYVIDKVVLDASLCGVPQKRKRLITIGSKNPSFVTRVFDYLKSNLASKPMTVRDWFGDSLGLETYYRHPRSYARRGVFSIDEPSPTIRGVNRPVPAGYPGHPGDVAPATSTRPLTTSERAEVQTFPDDFQWIGSRTNVEQMIGNAVPARMAEYIATAILSALKVEDNGRS